VTQQWRKYLGGFFCAVRDELKFDKSGVQSVVIYSPASKGVQAEAGKDAGFKAVTRQRLAKTQQTEKP
jgi:hypothetical protein